MVVFGVFTCTERVDQFIKHDKDFKQRTLGMYLSFIIEQY